VTIGSDAHRPEHFAWGLGEGYAIAVGAGFDELTFRRGPGTERTTIGIPADAASASR